MHDRETRKMLPTNIDSIIFLEIPERYFPTFPPTILLGIRRSKKNYPPRIQFPHHSEISLDVNHRPSSVGYEDQKFTQTGDQLDGWENRKGTFKFQSSVGYDDQRPIHLH